MRDSPNYPRGAVFTVKNSAYEGLLPITEVDVQTKNNGLMSIPYIALQTDPYR